MSSYTVPVIIVNKTSDGTRDFDVRGKAHTHIIMPKEPYPIKVPTTIEGIPEKIRTYHKLQLYIIFKGMLPLDIAGVIAQYHNYMAKERDRVIDKNRHHSYSDKEWHYGAWLEDHRHKLGMPYPMAYKIQFGLADLVKQLHYYKHENKRKHR